MRPLVKVSTIIEDVANGNIEADFSVVKESNDEIGLIIEKKMKELTQSLGSIVGKIRNSSDTMSSNSYESMTQAVRHLLQITRYPRPSRMLQRALQAWQHLFPRLMKIFWR